jgi:hypothetical protein
MQHTLTLHRPQYKQWICINNYFVSDPVWNLTNQSPVTNTCFRPMSRTLCLKPCLNRKLCHNLRRQIYTINNMKTELIIVPNQMWIVSCNHWFQHRTQQKFVTNLETITNPWGPWVVARGTTQHPAKSRIVSNSLLPCVFTQRGFSIEYSSIDQHTFTAKSSGLSTMNATVKESLSIINWNNQSKQLFHIDVRLA